MYLAPSYIPSKPPHNRKPSNSKSNSWASFCQNISISKSQTKKRCTSLPKEIRERNCAQSIIAAFKRNHIVSSDEEDDLPSTSKPTRKATATLSKAPESPESTTSSITSTSNAPTTLARSSSLFQLYSPTRESATDSTQSTRSNQQSVITQNTPPANRR